MVVGFTVHENMNFIVSERRSPEKAVEVQTNGGIEMDAGALPGSYEYCSYMDLGRNVSIWGNLDPKHMALVGFTSLSVGSDCWSRSGLLLSSVLHWKA
jgi:hypothetical protein